MQERSIYLKTIGNSQVLETHWADIFSNPFLVYRNVKPRGQRRQLYHWIGCLHALLKLEFQRTFSHLLYVSPEYIPKFLGSVYCIHSQGMRSNWKHGFSVSPCRPCSLTQCPWTTCFVVGDNCVYGFSSLPWACLLLCHKLWGLFTHDFLPATC